MNQLLDQESLRNYPKAKIFQALKKGLLRAQFIMLILFIIIGFLSNAQTHFYTNITVNAFPQDPQSGQYNYFGVNVTLDQTYDQDITVTGYIHKDADEENNQDHPFTLTIPAGNLTAQTDPTFYQATPTDGAAATLASISPQTVTSGGVTFSTQGTSRVLDRLNAAGQLHNDYQEFLLNYVSSQNLDLTDTNNLKQVIYSKTSEFFQNNGLTINSPYEINFAALGDNAYQFSSDNFSMEGKAILDTLKSLIVNYDENNDASFFSALNSLQQQALNLSNQTEVYTVGIPVTVAIYSFSYWKNNAEKWADIFYDQDSTRKAQLSFNHYNSNLIHSLNSYSGPRTSDFALEVKMSLSPSCKINMWKLGGADVSGAVTGATAGSLGGVGGALAGGVLISATSSLGNLTNQVISCYVSWWPW